MMFDKPAYYTTNKEWYYIDPRKCTSKLTDKATPKAINSYIEHFSLLEGAPLSLNDEEFAELEKEIRERTKQEIRDYKENKERYTFETDERGNQILTKIDGKSIF